MKRVLIVLAVVVALSPLGLLAQLPVATDACMQAQMDAQADVNGTLWFFDGCISGFLISSLYGVLLGALGIGAAYVVEPSPPATRLLGQPPDYVAIYTDCYKEKGKSIQTSAALKGCVVGGLTGVGLWLVYLTALSSTAYYY